MWIRSQDKKNLANGEIIYFLGDCLTVRCGKVGTNDEYDLILAIYSTKEKAIKSLGYDTKRNLSKQWYEYVCNATR